MNESTALAVIAPSSLDEASRMADLLSKSPLLPQDLRDKPANVLVAILTGAELGMAPMQAIRGIQVIKGKPTLSADTMGALCKRRQDICEYLSLVDSTATSCTYEAKRKGEPKPTRLTFSFEDAQRAGLTGGDNYRKYPAAMLRARALSAICRAVFPDLCLGLYDPDELTEQAPPQVAVEPSRAEDALRAKLKPAQDADFKPAATPPKAPITENGKPVERKKTPWDEAVEFAQAHGIDWQKAAAWFKAEKGRASTSKVTAEDVVAYRDFVEHEPPAEPPPVDASAMEGSPF